MARNALWTGTIYHLAKPAAFNPEKPVYMLVRNNGGGTAANRVNVTEAEAIEWAKAQDEYSIEYNKRWNKRFI